MEEVVEVEVVEEEIVEVVEEEVVEIVEEVEEIFRPRLIFVPTSGQA